MNPARRPGAITHPCPGGCNITDVPHHRLACARCWQRLPAELRDLINRTYRLRHTGADARRNHVQALYDAHRWYRLHPATGGGPYLLTLDDGTRL